MTGHEFGPLHASPEADQPTIESSRGGSTVVFKLGGSLLTLPHLPSRLRSVLEQWPDANRLLVVGGGAATDVVRQWDRTHQLGDETAHRLALASLALNDTLLAELLPESRLVRDRVAASAAWQAGRLPILATRSFLESEEPTHAAAPTKPPDDLPPLPHDWNATSDSIAAWIAARWPADELVLLKSVDLSSRSSGRTNTGCDAVDPYFAEFARSVPRVHWINLRTNPTASVPWPSAQPIAD